MTTSPQVAVFSSKPLYQGSGLVHTDDGIALAFKCLNSSKADDEKLPQIFVQNPAKNQEAKSLTQEMIVTALSILKIDMKTVHAWQKHDWGFRAFFKEELCDIIDDIDHFSRHLH